MKGGQSVRAGAVHLKLSQVKRSAGPHAAPGGGYRFQAEATLTRGRPLMLLA